MRRIWSIRSTKMNQNSKRLANVDFISGYAQLGNKEYQYLMKFHEDSGLTITTCVTLLSNALLQMIYEMVYG